MGLTRQFHSVELNFQIQRNNYWHSVHSAMLTRGAETLQCQSAKVGWLSGNKGLSTPISFHTVVLLV